MFGGKKAIEFFQFFTREEMGMSYRRQSMLLVVIGAVALMWTVLRFVFHAEPMVNISNSEHVGLYILNLDPAKKISRGDLVAFCIPLDFARLAFRRTYFKASDQCPAHVIPVLKRVYGIPGDLVGLTQKGVVINGRMIPNTRRLERDTRNNPITHVRFEGRRSEYLLLAPTYHLSFDGRYFGPVSREQIIGTVTPLFTLRRVQ